MPQYILLRDTCIGYETRALATRHVHQIVPHPSTSDFRCVPVLVCPGSGFVPVLGLSWLQVLDTYKVRAGTCKVRTSRGQYVQVPASVCPGFRLVPVTKLIRYVFLIFHTKKFVLLPPFWRPFQPNSIFISLPWTWTKNIKKNVPSDSKNDLVCLKTFKSSLFYFLPLWD